MVVPPGAGAASQSVQSSQVALTLVVPTLTTASKGMIAASTSPAVCEALCRVVSSVVEALCRVVSLLLFAMEPELSSTSATHNLV